MNLFIYITASQDNATTETQQQLQKFNKNTCLITIGSNHVQQDLVSNYYIYTYLYGIYTNYRPYVF